MGCLTSSAQGTLLSKLLEGSPHRRSCRQLIKSTHQFKQLRVF